MTSRRDASPRLEPMKRATAICLTLMILGAVVMVYPYAYMVGASLKTRHEFTRDQGGLRDMVPGTGARGPGRARNRPPGGGQISAPGTDLLKKWTRSDPIKDGR